MPLPPTTHIGAVRLRTSRLSRSVEFYTEMLGLSLLASGDGLVSLGVLDAPLLLLEEASDARPRPPRTTGLYHFAILMPTRYHLARSLQRLVERRYPIQGAADHLVSEAVYLADPDGNGIEIYADRPRSAWPVTGGEIRMTTDPLDVDGLMAELRQDGGPWQGLAGGTVMGHVHLQVHNLAAAEAFYCDVLGFDLMQRYGGSALFVSAGGYHHHIGLNTWAGAGAPRPPAGAAGLVHYGIALPAADDLAALQQRLLDAGTPFEEAPGHIDLADPSGNGIRLLVV